MFDLHAIDIMAAEEYTDIVLPREEVVLYHIKQIKIRNRERFVSVTKSKFI